MFFVILGRLKRKPTKENVAILDKVLRAPKSVVKIHSLLWTLGRYDAVMLVEAPNVKAALAFVFDFADFAVTETLVAIPRDEAIRAVGLR